MKPARQRFARDTGPICYELPIFGSGDESDDAAIDELLGSRLSWLWESATRERRAAAGSSGSRELTSLDAARRPQLVADLRYRDEDRFGRFVALYGVRQAAALSPESLAEQIGRFAGESGPLEAVIVQLGDCPDEYLFVGHEPTPELEALLDALGIGGQEWADVPYERLYLASLESIFEL